MGLFVEGLLGYFFKVPRPFSAIYRTFRNYRIKKLIFKLYFRYFYLNQFFYDYAKNFHWTKCGSPAKIITAAERAAAEAERRRQADAAELERLRAELAKR